MSSLRYCTRCLTTFDTDPARCTNLSCARARPAEGWSTLLQQGDVLDRHYHIEQPLALGGAGLAYRARELDENGLAFGPDLAIKVLYAQRDQGSFLRRLSNEAQILQELDHPNIIECRGFVHRTGHAPYLVTLFEHGGNLGDFLEAVGPLPPRVAAGILRQVLQALHTAHLRGVIHRDLKPENVLLRERVAAGEIPRVRVADFGIAKVEALGGRVTRQGAFVGTPEFAAPEQFEGTPPTPATDIYAAGALFYTLLTGQDLLQFTDRLDPERCLDELARHLPPTAPETIADPNERRLVQAIFDGMMQIDPARRWDVPAVLEALGGLVGGTPDRALATIERDRQRTIDRPPSPDLDDATDPGSGLQAAMLGMGPPLLGLVLGVPLVVVALLVLAFALGHFAGAPSPDQAGLVGAVHVVASAPTQARDLSAASTPAEVAERDALVRAIATAAQALPRACGLRGEQPIAVRVSASGVIQELSAQGAPEDRRACLERVLRRAKLARTSPGDVRVGLTVRLP